MYTVAPPVTKSRIMALVAKKKKVIVEHKTLFRTPI